MVRIIRDVLRIVSTGYTAIDLTSYVRDFIETNGLREGFLYLSSRDPGVVISFIEYEPKLLRDLEKLLKNLGADEKKYIGEALLGKTAVLPIIDGEVYGGVFKHPVLIDLSHVEGVKEVLFIYEGV